MSSSTLTTISYHSHQFLIVSRCNFISSSPIHSISFFYCINLQKLLLDDFMLLIVRRITSSSLWLKLISFKECKFNKVKRQWQEKMLPGKSLSCVNRRARSVKEKEEIKMVLGGGKHLLQPPTAYLLHAPLYWQFLLHFSLFSCFLKDFGLVMMFWLLLSWILQKR